MVDQSRLWPASVDRHVQCIEHELGPQVVRHGPANDLPGVGVEYEREVEPSLPGTHVRDVRDPQAVRGPGGEVALHQVRSWGSMLGLCAEGRASLPPTPTASEQPRASRISLATRFLAHLMPSVLSSKWILGAP